MRKNKEVIYIGADHAGFKLKEKIKEFLIKKGKEVKDLGNTIFDKNDDYPDYGYVVTKAVSKNKNSKGILFCGSSYGICIVANKVKGIRAVSISTIKDAKLSREHNDANILCLPGWGFKENLAKKIVITWLKTNFSNKKRHKRRIDKIKRIEKEEFK